MNKDKFYITTAIAYTNAGPHLGHALEFIQADVIARWQRQNGKDVWFLTGTDEHGTKVSRTAQKAQKDEQEFVDEISQQFSLLDKDLNISNDDFIRTSDRVRHWPSVIKLWNKLVENGDLYKKEYEGFYCIGHEAFIKKSELIDGLCPLHKTEPETVREENWFFKLSKYKDEIKGRIMADEIKVVPETRKNEIVNLVDDAEDVSFSRPSKDLKWGIPVPGDDSQTMYVWADALTNYASAVGYADESANFKKWWPADVHLIGKDILRFHALYWPAMLLSANMALPKNIYVHGFITVDGEKMSKSIGNIIDPFHLIEKYGSEVVRYFLMREIPSGEDGDFSYKKLEERYNGDLANGLGNLIQRVVTLIENSLDGELIYNQDLINKDIVEKFSELSRSYEKRFIDFRLHDALTDLWQVIGVANAYVDENKPWAQAKENPEKFLITMTNLVYLIHNISWLLEPFMPETAKKIFATFGDSGEKEILNNYRFRINKGEPLFPRLK
mgnify:CR=1 FL=1